MPVIRKGEVLRLADFGHRVQVCTMEDVRVSNDTMSLIRKDVYKCWARIEPVRQTMFTRKGFAAQDPIDERTHEIYIRYNRNIDFTSSAWMFEARRKSPPRWYKLLRYVVFREEAEYIQFDAKLVEQSDMAVRPLTHEQQRQEAEKKKFTDAAPLPQGVKL